MLRVQTIRRELRHLQNIGHQWIELVSRLHPCTETLEILSTHSVHDRLGENAPCGVPIGKKKDVVMAVRHGVLGLGKPQPLNNSSRRWFPGPVIATESCASGWNGLKLAVLPAAPCDPRFRTQ